MITATFGIEKESLADLLHEAEHGKAQLPDFQRGWVWDDAQRWCRDQGIPPARCDSIVNKTPLSARTNRVIGGRAQSEYLSRLQNSAGLTAEQLDGHLRTQLVDPAFLRADDLQVFVAARLTGLLGRIEQVMAKRIDPGGPAEPEDEPVNYEVVEGYEDLEGDAA